MQHVGFTSALIAITADTWMAGITAGLGCRCTMVEANAARGFGTRITVLGPSLEKSRGTIRQPAEESRACSAAFLFPTNEMSLEPADSMLATLVISFSPSPSNTAFSRSASSRTRTFHLLTSVSYKGMSIDPSAIIAPTARVHPESSIGPQCVIGDYCVIE